MGGWWLEFRVSVCCFYLGQMIECMNAVLEMFGKFVLTASQNLSKFHRICHSHSFIVCYACLYLSTIIIATYDTSLPLQAAVPICYYEYRSPLAWYQRKPNVVWWKYFWIVLLSRRMCNHSSAESKSAVIELFGGRGEVTPPRNISIYSFNFQNNHRYFSSFGRANGFLFKIVWISSNIFLQAYNNFLYNAWAIWTLLFYKFQILDISAIVLANLCVAYIMTSQNEEVLWSDNIYSCRGFWSFFKNEWLLKFISEKLIYKVLDEKELYVWFERSLFVAGWEKCAINRF